MRGSLGMGILPTRGKKVWVLVEAFLYLRACAGDARLDGPQRHPHHTGDLVVRHAVDVTKNDRQAHVRLQRLDTFAHQSVTLARLGALLRIGRRNPKADDVTRLVILGHGSVSLASPKVVVTEVGRNLKEPGLEGRVTQRPDLLPGARKGLLRDVSGIV